MSKFILIWEDYEGKQPFIGDPKKGDSASRNIYTSLEKARAAAYRKAYAIYLCNFSAIRVYEMVDGKKHLKGSVVYDSNYRYGGSSGVMWVPPNATESMIVSGVSSTGKLNHFKYRLT